MSGSILRACQLGAWPVFRTWNIIPAWFNPKQCSSVQAWIEMATLHAYHVRLMCTPCALEMR
jgi:hypothetical protein